jgi:glycosyltransferase involved in cell wall biosynthesis
MFGVVSGRFFIGRNLGITGDDTPDTFTLSELVETFPQWRSIVAQVPYKVKQLYTMFETSDIHPDVAHAMKAFDRVLVPFPYLRDILTSHGVNAISMDFYTSDLIRSAPQIITKSRDSSALVFLYVGTNDTRKNVVRLTKVFSEFSKGTKHKLIVKTNVDTNLTVSPNIKVITNRLELPQLAGLYNICDYVISLTRGEGVGLPMLEANYFGKPIIAHDRGVFADIKKFVNVSWTVLEADEVRIDYKDVPPYLYKVFYNTWWDVSESSLLKVLTNIV